MGKRVADVLIETLQAAGVKRCYGIVGDTLNRIAHAIDAGEIEWVHMRHEESGAFAAGAEAHLTGCAGTCVYSARAMLQGKGHDVWEMMVENIP
jgi:pyruvate dehydrogenase (quinone)